MKQMSLILLFAIGLAGCATSKSPNDFTTEAESIFVNSPDEVKDCKYIGLIEVDGHKDWKKRILKQGARMGATHVYSAGATTVARDKENLQTKANAYRCKEALEKMNDN